MLFLLFDFLDQILNGVFTGHVGLDTKMSSVTYRSYEIICPLLPG